MRPGRLALVLLAFIPLACGPLACAPLTMNAKPPKGAPPVAIEYAEGLADDARLVSETLNEIWPRLGVFGALRAPLTIALYAEQTTIESHAGLSHSPWLRAWATYERIDLQTPSRWQGPCRREHLAALLLHELTHLAMYQRVGTRDDWHKKPLPLWFREGLATFVAGEGDNPYTPERLRDFYLSADYPGDPVLEGESLLQSHPREVYAASHLFMQALVARHGNEKIGRVLDLLRAGQGFLEAWQNATGTPLAADLADWRGTLLSPPR